MLVVVLAGSVCRFQYADKVTLVEPSVNSSWILAKDFLREHPEIANASR